MSEPAELRHSRRLCAQICRQSKSSFLTSFALLDRPRRQAMCALYAFARTTDDIADTAEAVELRAIKLAHWRDRLWRQCAASPLEWQCDGAASLSEDSTTTTIWPAVRDCIRRYHIRNQLLDDIITGVAMDLEPQQPRDWSELDHYCYHVASTVGLACAQIWRADGPGPMPRADRLEASSSAMQSAIDCGIAFQLTNILRDIAEDARRGRIYVPQSQFIKYRVDTAQWLAGHPTGNWEAMLDDMAHRARQFYTRGWHTIVALTPHSQRMFSLMWRSYRGLLECVVTNKRRLWGRDRIRLPNSQRLKLLTTHFVPPMYARLSPP